MVALMILGIKYNKKNDPMPDEGLEWYFTYRHIGMLQSHRVNWRSLTAIYILQTFWNQVNIDEFYLHW